MTCAGRRGCVSAHTPNIRMNSDNRVKKINPSFLPSSYAAIQLYEQRGGRIREVSEFGRDPIADNVVLEGKHSLKSISHLS